MNEEYVKSEVSVGNYSRRFTLHISHLPADRAGETLYKAQIANYQKN